MRRTKEASAQTREQLLDAALDVFSRKGYAATTLQDIAEAAHLTRGAVYWHFDGKPSLYEALLAERTAPLLSLWGQPASPTKSASDALRDLMLGSLLLSEDPRLRAVLALAWYKTERAPELEEGFQRKITGIQQMIERIQAEIERGQQSGELDAKIEPAASSLAAFALLSGLLSLHIMDRSLGDPRRWTLAVEGFLRSLR